MITVVVKPHMATGIVAVAVFLLCCVSAQAQAVVAAWQYTTPDGEVYISRDGGVQWLHKNMPTDGVQKLLLTTANGARFRSEDGGESWTAEPQLKVSANGVRKLLLTTANGARFHSEDGGELWIAEQKGKKREDAVLSSVSETREQVGVSLRLTPTFVRDNVSIWYSVPETQQVELALVDVLGNRVRTVYTGLQQAGEHVFEVTTHGYTPGVYFVHLRTPVGTAVQQVVVQP